MAAWQRPIGSVVRLHKQSNDRNGSFMATKGGKRTLGHNSGSSGYRWETCTGIARFSAIRLMRNDCRDVARLAVPALLGTPGLPPSAGGFYGSRFSASRASARYFSASARWILDASLAGLFSRFALLGLAHTIVLRRVINHLHDASPECGWNLSKSRVASQRIRTKCV